MTKPTERKPKNQTAYPFDATVEDAGMSLRDYFAGQALTGMLANRKYDIYGVMSFAEESYHQADAMLKAREATND